MTTETEGLVLVCEPESVAEVLEEMQGLAEAAEAREFDITLEDLRDYAQRIAAAHAREVGAKQAEIDRVMLEYCPDEMTQEQVKTWGKSQRVVKPRVTQSTNTQPLCIHCNQPTMHMGNVCYRCSHLPTREVIR